MAAVLHLPLDIFLVRRFAPTGLVASGGIEIVEDSGSFNLPHEHAEVARRERSYRQSRPAESITGRSLIVVDDGLTTGSTMRDAIRALRQLEPLQIIAAVPVASAEVCDALETEADTVICARKPEAFFSVRRSYRDFSPVLDEDIRQSLASAFGPTAFRA